MMAKTLNIDGLEKYLKDMRDFKRSEMIRAKTNAESYYNGYQDGIYDAINILNSSNYELDKKESEGEKNEGYKV